MSAGVPGALRQARFVVKTMAELIATGETPELIEPFGLERFYTGDLIGEKAAASVGS